MARIPVGQFGFRTPQGGDVTPGARVDTQVGDAANRLGATLTSIGAQQFSDLAHEQRVKEAEAKAAADRAAQAQTALAHVNIQNNLADSFDALNRDVLDGKTDKIAALGSWKDTSAKIVEANIKGLPSDRAALLSAQAKGIEGKLTNGLFDTFRKRDDQTALADVSTAEEGLQRLARNDLSGAIKQQSMLIDGSPLAPDVKAKRKQVFVESAYFNDFRAKGQAAMQTGDPAAIDEVQKRLSGPEGDVLDPAKRNILDQTLFGWRGQLVAKQEAAANKAERQQEKRDKAAAKSVTSLAEIVATGALVAPEAVAQAAADAQGTASEEQFRQVMETQRAAGGFGSKSLPEQGKLLERIASSRVDPAVGTTPEREKVYNTLNTIHARQQKMVDDGEAWKLAASNGTIPAAPLVNLADPQAAMNVVQHRMAQIGDVEAMAGRPVSPLQPAEAEQLTKMVRALKPDQAASMFAQMGAVVGDADRISAIAKQVGDKDGTLGMAMLYSNAKTTEGRYTAQLVLEGKQKITDKVVKPDGMAESGWKAEIAKKVRGAYSNNEVETNIVEAAFLIAAATDGDVERAIRLASGGIVERNGGKIPLPYGMKEADFDKRIEGITPAAFVDQAPDGFVMAGPVKMPLADFVKTLPDARLVHAGQGAYNVRAGNQLVTNERGQRITIKVAP